MAAAQVFIDDAVRGTLPDVCVKDGVPAGGSRVRMSREIGRSNRLGILWLLLFLGPIGWVVLVFLAAGDKGERLTVTLPLSEAAHERQVAATRRRNVGVSLTAVGGFACLGLAIFAGIGTTPLGFLGLGGLVTAFVLALVGEVRIDRTTVGLELDASRRWLTITQVHPAFAQAYAAQEAERTTRRV